MIASRDAHRTSLPSSIGEELRSTLVASNTFKKAYERGLSVAGIRNPSLKYRTAIERIRQTGAVQIQDDLDPEASITIAHVKRV
jgi:hypothetical protein